VNEYWAVLAVHGGVLSDQPWYPYSSASESFNRGVESSQW
jgi:hypothetical protein